MTGEKFIARDLGISQPRRVMGFVDYLVLVLYFGGMIAIGIWSMKRVKGQDDYFMGGRGFGKLMQTFAAFGAGTGSDEPVRVGSTAWGSGLSGVWSALMWLFVTPVYWITAVWYRRMRHTTLGEWFVERYESRGLGAFYAVFAIVFYIFYLSGMFTAISKVAVPLLGVEEFNGIELKFFLVPLIALIIVLYGVLGGLAAAYWTDLIQGIFIIILSVLLIPYGLWALVKEFGDPATMSVMDGFTIMHERVSPENFDLFGGPSASEFTPLYIFSLTLIALVGIVVQPHFIATGGGTAKGEDEARIGLVVGNFLKRLCTAGWALTALIALALLAGNAEIAANPDHVWGVAAREILGPLKLGLVGLMLACLMAAMMSSADCYMIVTSALVVKNIYAPYIDPKASEKRYVMVGRLTGLIIIVGAAVVSLTMSNVFAQFKLAIELPILFAAPFWIGMYWRRANRTAVWITIIFSALFFFILPQLIPALMPGLRSDEGLTVKNTLIETPVKRDATEADVAKHEGWVQATKDTRSKYADNEEKLNSVLAAIGAEPPFAAVGSPIEFTRKSGGKPIFWRGGVDEGDDGIKVGKGALNLDMMLYHRLGMDLSTKSKATLEALRLPPRVLLPFLVLIGVSLLTPRNSPEVLDRYYAKMKTEVDADREADAAKLEAAFADPSALESRKMFPGSDIEVQRPRAKDIVGFVAACMVCVAVIGLLAWLAGIGG